MGRHFEVRQASMQKTALKKSKVYSRYGKEIYIAAKAGIPNPEMNQGLKQKIAEAKSNQVPAHVIDNAIKKAQGNTGEHYETARYEGFGPGESTILVDCLTDNLNRSLSDVRTCFNRAKAKMGSQGSVSFLYDQYGQFVFKYDNLETVMERLFDAEIEVEELEQEAEYINVLVQPHHFGLTRQALDGLLGEDYEYEVNEIGMFPQALTKIEDPADLEVFKKLVDMLEEVDDVQKVYHNVENMNEA